MDKQKRIEDIVGEIPNHSSICLGGFYGVGTPHKIIDEIIRQEKKGLTLITAEGGWPDKGCGKLLSAGCLKKIIVSWVGNLTTITDAVNNNDVILELNPQGTLIERLRAAGSGLGGVLTKVGLGTEVEINGTGKRVSIDAEDWLFHKPLQADFGLVAANRADTFGNLIFVGTENNYNEWICKSAKKVVAEVGTEPVEAGNLNPYEIAVSGIFVDYLVKGWA